MAFTEAELTMIDETVGALCRASSASAPADQFRFRYAIDGHAIELYEERVASQPEVEGLSLVPVARFRYYRRRGEWFLYWMPASGRWDYYEGPRRRLKSLIRFVQEDEYGCFYG